MAQVVVVGAGIGGLAVAARLAARRHRVTVLEQAPVVGGKAGTYTRDAFTFDTGPSLLTLPAVYRDLFIKTGAPLETAVQLVPVDPALRYRFNDGTSLDVPNRSPGLLRRRLNWALGPGAGDDWLALLERAGLMWQVTRRPFLESPLDRRALLRGALRPRHVAAIAPFDTLRGFGRRHLRDPRLRLLLDRYATYTGSDPRRAPAALAVIPYVEHTFGAWHVEGGVRRLVDAVAERARGAGAEIRTGADVTEIVTDRRGVTGVRLADGERIAADVVVANADAAHVYGDLVHAPRELRRVSRAAPSLSGFVLLLALRGRTPELAHHTVLFPDDYDAEFDSVFGPEPCPVDDPVIYVNAPDDPALRPDGCEALFVLVNAPRQGPVDWTASGLAEKYADHVLAVLARRGVDVRDRVLWREIRTPADLERDTRSPGGSIYGTSSNGRRAAFLRPPNRSSIEGLFLVGGSTHPGGGLPLVGLGAASVASLVASYVDGRA